MEMNFEMRMGARNNPFNHKLYMIVEAFVYAAVITLFVLNLSGRCVNNYCYFLLGGFTMIEGGINWKRKNDIAVLQFAAAGFMIINGVLM